MDYDLSRLENKEKAEWLLIARRYLGGQWGRAFLALITVLIGAAAGIFGPYVIGLAIDEITLNQDFQAALGFLPILIIIYVINFFSDYSQIIIMGFIGQNILFNLRQQIFAKLQSLPLSFFNANKAGDLISRINRDTEKINSVISEGLIRLLGSIFSLVGVAIAMFIINWQLAATVLSLTVALIIITQALSPLLRRLNRNSLNATGDLSAQIQETLSGFKAIVAYNRQDFAVNKFDVVNLQSKKSGNLAAIFNQILSPIYDLATNIASLLVILVGIRLSLDGIITFGTLFTFITYTRFFYEPLRSFASIWSSVQSGMAAWTRISDILDLKSNLDFPDKNAVTEHKNTILELNKVSFGYQSDNLILEEVSLVLEEGKTYALVGPTGGGKSTTASLMSRLYDPTSGEVLLLGQDIKAFTQEQLADIIGFILQDPYLFTGTVAENITYGLKQIHSEEELVDKLSNLGLALLLEKFPDGLKTQVTNDAENISLGQKQLIAFMRILLRQPKLLILDEATANIDTVTEELLEKIIAALPKETTKVIIAHRLNTIDNADEIIFVGGGKLQSAKDVENVKELLNKD